MINESLRASDLRGFIKKIIEVDAFKSKIGDDEDIVTMSFTVTGEDAAKDLEHFIEMGYEFVLDADTSPGELDDGKYRVYVEIERTRHCAKQIFELLSGVEKLTGDSGMRFRYYKNFKSQDASLENLELTIPKDPNSYKDTIQRHSLDNFSNFFSNSYADEIEVVDESISFKRIYGDKVTFDIVASGPKKAIYAAIEGPIILESKAVAETMFLTKYIGNYNITKVGKTFVFENNQWAVALIRKV